MKTTSIMATAIGCLFSFNLFGQLNVNTYEFASTEGDNLGLDGYASDGCSEAIAISDLDMSLYITQDVSCDCFTGGAPYAELSRDLEISNPPANTFPASNYLGHTVPFGFKTEVSIDHFGDIFSASFDYNHSYGAGSTAFNSGTFIDLLNGITTVKFSGEENLILPVGNLYMSLSASLSTVTCGGTFMETEALFDGPNLILPSQFYADNGITVPSTITISGNAFDVETVCAENMYLQNVELDSYHYGTAGDMYFDAEVVNSANVTASASSSITFGPGFFVDASSSFSTTTYVGCTP